MVKIYVGKGDILCRHAPVIRDWDSFHQIYIARRSYRTDIDLLCVINDLIFIIPIKDL